MLAVNVPVSVGLHPQCNTSYRSVGENKYTFKNVIVLFILYFRALIWLYSPVQIFGLQSCPSNVAIHYIYFLNSKWPLSTLTNCIVLPSLMFIPTNVFIISHYICILHILCSTQTFPRHTNLPSSK